MKNRSVALGFPLELATDGNLTDRLCASIREAILTGRLLPGSRIASSRDLHKELGISRSTVVEAFEQLVVEGYLTSRTGLGSFVTDSIPESFQLVKTESSQTKQNQQRSKRLSSRVTAILNTKLPNARFANSLKPFRPGVGTVDLFPTKLWSTLTKQAWIKASRNQLGYGDAAGQLELRKAIAEHVRYTRGGSATAEQVIVTTGAQQGIHLVTSLLLSPGDSAFIEEPCYLAARLAIQSALAKPISIPVDDEGVRIPPSGKQGSLLFTTPSFQYPLGREMSLARRLELLCWAEQNECYILEDDYDCEFRFEGRPTPSLHALDSHGLVIYCGSFSKSLAPALRVGFLILPENLVAPALSLLKSFGRGVSTVDQLVLAKFISDGHFSRYTRIAREQLVERREILFQECQKLNRWMHTAPTKNGLHLLAEFKSRIDDCEISQRADSFGLQLTPLSPGQTHHFKPVQECYSELGREAESHDPSLPLVVFFLH